jgi:hypothetical protein
MFLEDGGFELLNLVVLVTFALDHQVLAEEIVLHLPDRF